MNRLPKAEVVLPFLIVFAAAVLIASEFMTAFEFTPPGGEALREAGNADRHDYSMLILGFFAIAAMLVAVVTGARPAAYAVAAAGGIALLLFLVVDLPDAGKLGDLEDPIRGFASARAEPQEGFWLEAIGAVTLALAGGAFATLTPDQLRAGRGNRKSPITSATPIAGASPPPASPTTKSEGDANINRATTPRNSGGLRHR
jgi:hypothetical protein